MAADQTQKAPSGETPVKINRVLQQSTLYLIGNVASRAFGFIAIPFYSRFLTPTQYGIIDLIELSTQIIAIAFGLQSIGMVLARIVNEQTTVKDEHAVVSTGLIATAMLSGAIAVCAVFAAAPLSEAVFHSADRAPLLQAAFIAMFFSNLVEVILVYERIRERARFYLIYSLVTLAINLLLNIYFIGIIQLGVYGFVASKLVVTIGGSAFLVWRVMHEVGWTWRRRYIPEFIRFGVPLVLSGISYFAIHFSDRFFLTDAVSLADLGRYGLAYRFAFLVSVLVGDSFAKSWNVTLYRYAGKTGWQPQFARVATYLVFVLCIAALAISIFGPELLRLMVPESFYPPPLLLPMLVVSYVFRECGDFFRTLLLINKRSNTVGQIAFSGAVLNCALNYLMIPTYGIYGAAGATLATWIAYMIVCWITADREHKIPVRVGPFLLIMTMMTGVYAAADVLRHPNPFIQTGFDLLWVLLFAVLALMFYFSADERAEITTSVANLAGRLLTARGTTPGVGRQDDILLLSGSSIRPSADGNPMAAFLTGAGYHVTAITPRTAGASGSLAGSPRAGWLISAICVAAAPFIANMRKVPRLIAASHPYVAMRNRRVLLSTQPTLAGHLAALWLHRRHGMAWIANLQAPLATLESAPPTALARGLARGLEWLIVHNADVLLTGTEQMAQAWRQRFPSRADRIHSFRLPLAHPPHRDPAAPARGPLRRLSCIHRLHHADQLPILDSILRLLTAGRLTPADLHLRLVGPVDGRLDLHKPPFSALIALGCLDVENRALSDPEAQREMLEADGLIFQQSATADDALTLPDRLFDGLAAHRPILAAAAPGSALAQILADSSTASLCLDPAAPPQTIDDALAAFIADPTTAAAPDAGFWEAFSAARQKALFGDITAPLGLVPHIRPLTDRSIAHLPATAQPARIAPLEKRQAAPDRAPRISVIMAVYNGADLISHSIDSLLSQTFRNFELLVVNDCSTDTTVDVLQQYNDPRIRVLHNPRNIGVVASRNIAFAAARGDYIAILDHDDLSHPHRLAREAAYLDAHPETALVSTDGRIFQNGALRRFDLPQTTTPAFLRWLMSVRNPVISSSVMLRASLARQQPSFMDPDYECAEDFHLYHQMLRSGDIARLDQSLTIYRLHQSNMTRTRRDFVVSQTIKVFKTQYTELLGDQAHDAAILITRHIVAGIPAPDMRTLVKTGQYLDRIRLNHQAAHTLSPSNTALIDTHTARLWWNAVRSAVRSGRPWLILALARLPAMPTGAGIPATEQIGAVLRGMIAIAISLPLFRHTRAHPRANAQALRPPVPAAPPQHNPFDRSRPPTLYAIVEPGRAAPGPIQSVCETHGIHPIYLLDAATAADPQHRAALAAGQARHACSLGAWLPDAASLNPTLDAIGQNGTPAPLFCASPATSQASLPLDLLRSRDLCVDFSDQVRPAVRFSRINRLIDRLRGLPLRQAMRVGQSVETGQLFTMVDLSLEDADTARQMKLAHTMLRRGANIFVLRVSAAAQASLPPAELAQRLDRLAQAFFDEINGLPGVPTEFVSPARRSATAPAELQTA